MNDNMVIKLDKYPKIRRKWMRNPIEKIKQSAKRYNRAKAKRELHHKDIDLW